jgi:opacity protein-like surface antigen
MAKQILIACAMLVMLYNETSVAKRRSNKNLCPPYKMCIQVNAATYDKIKKEQEALKRSKSRSRSMYQTLFGSHKIYVGASVGATIYEKFDSAPEVYKKIRLHSSPVYNISVGRTFTKSTRADLNLNYSSWKYKQNASTSLNYVKQKGSQTSLILDGYYNLDTRKKLIPYITAGAGISRLNTGNIVLGSPISYSLQSKNVFNLVWNAGAGAAYIINNKCTVDAKYLYTNYGRTKTFDTSGYPLINQFLIAHTFNIGLRVFI